MNIDIHGIIYILYMFKISNHPNFWRYLVYLWTLIFYAAAIYDFIHNNAFQELLRPLAAIYIAILAIYAGEKEFERWHSFYRGKHPGELFVAGWSLLLIVLLLAEFVFKKSYHVPGEVIYTYITVLSILAITRKSRSLYEQKQEASDSSQGQLMV